MTQLAAGTSVPSTATTVIMRRFARVAAEALKRAFESRAITVKEAVAEELVA